MMLRRANPGMMMLAPLVLQVPAVVVDNSYPVLQTEHVVPARLQTSQFDGHATQAFEAVPVVNPFIHWTQCPGLAA
jgi:hypothetical protein